MQETRIFTDGGTIGINPSPHGGSWAYRMITDGQVVEEQAGAFSPKDFGMEACSCNLAEFVAALYAIESVAPGTKATILTDSEVTVARIKGGKTKGIPQELADRFHEELSRREIDATSVRAHLAQKHLPNDPEKVHNLWCDWACVTEANDFIKKHGLPVKPKTVPCIALFGK